MANEDQTVLYELADVHWPGSKIIEILDIQAQVLVTIPIDFLQQGKTYTWAYILKIVFDAVVEEGCIHDPAGQIVSTTQTPATAGRYTYIRTDDPSLPCSYRKGPQGKTKGKPPSGRASSSTHSNSSRSSMHQNSFRTALIWRDGYCLVSGSGYMSCIPSHIVPQSRGSELVSEILQKTVRSVYHISMGLLLRDDLHRALDRYDWGLHCKDDGKFIVHFFVFASPDWISFHGKVIDPAQMRGEITDRPNEQLLAWQYRQCVQMHFRGFAHRMSPDDAINEVAANSIGS